MSSVGLLIIILALQSQVLISRIEIMLLKIQVFLLLQQLVDLIFSAFYGRRDDLRHTVWFYSPVVILILKMLFFLLSEVYLLMEFAKFLRKRYVIIINLSAFLLHLALLLHKSQVLIVKFSLFC